MSILWATLGCQASSFIYLLGFLCYAEEEVNKIEFQIFNEIVRTHFSVKYSPFNALKY